MITIEHTEVWGWVAAIRGMRNPMNSWDKSDSFQTKIDRIADDDDTFIQVDRTGIGENDLALMKKLVRAGSDHSKFMRMIHVQFDVTAPLYWWKEFDTYKVGTVANSCSTMHKIHEREFTVDDFSREHLFYGDDVPYVWDTLTIGVLNKIVDILNEFRFKYIELKNRKNKSDFEKRLMKRYWWQMIQLLPSSYNQKRTLDLNYAVLRNMYHARRNHKLDEWHAFCHWIECLPYSELITLENPDKEIKEE